ncbi:transposable element tc1 transposase protein [Rutstroemia sp. NJR-2017a BBW]|nr:transposable element tc1 transposase protein [Rutstroemia sp. NJR-2017a BBW]
MAGISGCASQARVARDRESFKRKIRVPSTLKPTEHMVLKWPHFSANLHPIENIMKDWINDHYPEDHISYNRLREAVVYSFPCVSSCNLRRLFYHRLHL